jgi:hypothetical protein
VTKSGPQASFFSEDAFTLPIIIPLMLFTAQWLLLRCVTALTSQHVIRTLVPKLGLYFFPVLCSQFSFVEMEVLE